MFISRRKLLSQNFLHNRKLVLSLIRKSSIGENDTAIDLGAGKGIITKALAFICKHVIALELDPKYYQLLIQQFKYQHNITIFHQDILTYFFPHYPYKVFANIPFSIEGKIIRLLLNCDNTPEDMYLVLRRDLAYRLAGVRNESLFSVLYKPWFDFEIIHYFQRTDFSPYARVWILFY